jgi:ABC-type multidrug transport system ATPase subunit
VTGQSLLSAGRLTKAFAAQPPGSAAAVSDVTLDLRPHEVVAIVGANGAGKTTLVDLLATVLAPTSGSLRIAGRDARVDPRAARAAIGYVPAGGRSLYPRLTPLDNLRFFASLHGFCPADAVPRAEAALRLCGAWDARHTRVDRLSDGLVGRVTLARALLHDPAVLLLDEPTRSIDPAQRPALLRVIGDYARQPGKAAVFVTHDLQDVFDIADRVGVMRAGRLTVDDVAAARTDRGLLTAAGAESCR